MGLEGGQSEKAAMPTRGEQPPGAREGSALRSDVAMDEALDVAGIVRPALTLLGGECLKSLRSSEGILR